jgi:hypothetical protein
LTEPEGARFDALEDPSGFIAATRSSTAPRPAKNLNPTKAIVEIKMVLRH